MKIRSADKLRIFILIALTAIILVLMLGAAGNSPGGRYQVTAGGGVNPIVLDTVTGEWKVFNVSDGSIQQSGHW